MCVVCGINKSSPADTTRCEECRERERARSQAVRQELRAKLAEIRTYYGCQNPKCPCPITAPPFSLDFHHLGNKDFNLSDGHEKRIAVVMNEVNKCTVLCAYCHRLEQHGGLDASGFPKCRVNPDGSIQPRFT